MQLHPHPDAPDPVVGSIDAAVTRDSGQWRFRFVVEGTGALVVPPPAAAGRADGLWKHSCFEAFVAIDDRAYVELNFSPSGAWAAYRFDDYRAGMRDEPAAIAIAVERSHDRLTLEAAVTSDSLLAGAALGLSAVIEGAAGTRHWALAHPAGAADFHARPCFRARLPE